MVLTEKSRIVVEVDGKVVFIHKVMLDKQGGGSALIWPPVPQPDYVAAAVLLSAVSDLLDGSEAGQPVMAALSLCKTRIMRAKNENGNLPTEVDELPF